MEKISNIFLLVISSMATMSLIYNIFYNITISTSWTVFFIVLLCFALVGILVAVYNFLAMEDE